MKALTLHSPISDVYGIGEALTKKFRNLGVETCEDLLFHLPTRYEDFRSITAISQLQPDTMVTIKARVELIQNKRSPRKKMIITEGLLTDASGSVKAIWFRQPFITKNLKIGAEVFLSGKVVADAFGLQLQNPTYESVSTNPTHTARLVPVYPATYGLTQKQIRYVVKRVLPMCPQLQDPLPEDLRTAEQLLSLSNAIQRIHGPSSFQDIEDARMRLGIDELLIVQLGNALLKQDLDQQRAEPIPFSKDRVQVFVQNLPFQLTNAQRKSAWQILQDLERTHPMNRLLEGDVGSGKTVVAAIAVVNVAEHKKQTAYMAPTEILASQHYTTFRTLLPSNAVALLTSSRSEVNGAPCSRAELQRQIAGNDIDLVIGTHALIQEDVRFLDLAFAIVDEQHRFGVEQRKKLRAMSGNPETLPHLLSMTATPIPRTLALTIFGDLDLSILDEKPQNRTPIQTRRASLTNLESVFSHIQSEVQSGHQAFVVCPLIQESDILPRSSAESVYAEWKQRMPNIRMELLHGKMKTADKESTMQQFYGHNIDVLIATAVIEVGVDVPNATMMVILGAERFGLAQLHQFRGRVGRAEHASYCYVIPDDDNSGRERIDAFVASNDGFQLAEFDLQSRGPGEVYGRRQSGIPNFNVATLQDAHMIQRAQQLTRNILERDSTLTTFPILQQRVHQFLEQLHLE